MKNISHFKYEKKSIKIINWGCSFDSLTEIKFTLSIMDEFEFLRERVSIYYHPGTLLPTEYIRDCHRRYTPDFLIRHKQTREAFLIEVKPSAYRNHPQLILRQKVAENYIKWKGYDWKFKIVFDNEIFLDSEQLASFEECRKLKSKSSFKLWFQQYNSRFDRSAAPLFSRVPNDKDVRFIMFGERSLKKLSN